MNKGRIRDAGASDNQMNRRRLITGAAIFCSLVALVIFLPSLKLGTTTTEREADGRTDPLRWRHIDANGALFAQSGVGKVTLQG
jgi:hypothetical protein